MPQPKVGGHRHFRTLRQHTSRPCSADHIGRNGKFLLKRKTQRDRLLAKLKQVKAEMRQRRHQSIPEQAPSARIKHAAAMTARRLPAPWHAEKMQGFAQFEREV